MASCGVSGFTQWPKQCKTQLHMVQAEIDRKDTSVYNCILWSNILIGNSLSNVQISYISNYLLRSLHFCITCFGSFRLLTMACNYNEGSLPVIMLTDACPPLARQVVSSPPGRVIPKTIIKMVQTASLHRHACVRVGVWQCSPTV